MKKLIFIISCIVSVSYNATSQVISVVSVEGISFADTVQYNSPFLLNFNLVNTGSIDLIDTVITANLGVNPINVAPQNWQILTFTQNIPLGILAPGDSIIFEVLINGGAQLYQQSGDNLVVIWPSFVTLTPISSDTSITPLYVLPPVTSVNELNYPIYEESDNFIYDLLGRRYYNINTLIKGTMYIRDGKKYIKK